MTILHGHWHIPALDSIATSGADGGGDGGRGDGSGLFIWAETWRPVTGKVPSIGDILDHPLANSARETKQWLAEQVKAGRLREGAIAALAGGESRWLAIALPTLAGTASPIHSQKGANRGNRDRETDLEMDLELDELEANSGSGQEAADPKPEDEDPTAIDQNAGQPSAMDSAGTTIRPAHVPNLPFSPRLQTMTVPRAASTKTAALYPWWVEGWWLPPAAAVQLLQALPLSQGDSALLLGSGLRFWSQVARWSLDLAARFKALPQLTVGVTEVGLPQAIASWQPLLSSAIDQARWQRFAQTMPGSCRAAQHLPKPTPEAKQSVRAGDRFIRVSAYRPLSLELPPSPRRLIQDFLTATIDVRLRASAATLPLPGERRVGRSAGGLTTTVPIAPAVRDWLRQLGTPTGHCQTPLQDLEPLSRSLQAWQAPIDRPELATVRAATGRSTTKPPIGGDFRPAVRLRSPQVLGTESGPESGASGWRLEFGLQAVDEPDLWLSAADVWSFPVEWLRWGTRLAYQPQEALLRGLGLAARLFPPIGRSLTVPDPRSCDLTPAEAYQFVKLQAWRLQETGLGAVLPPSLRDRGSGSGRLGLRVATLETGGLAQKQGLGLKSLLNFRWELSIAGQSLSQEAFEELLARVDLDQMPLVELNGQWVELRPSEVRAAQEFLAKRQGELALSLEDVLRFSTGETTMIDRLPLVEFESSGAITDLMAAINQTDQVGTIEPPRDLQGQLRPYQQLGVAWLSFLERWNLGACLADDMGLGKTVSLISLLLHLRENDRLGGPTLLVCPTSILGNWEREVRKFAPTLTTLLHYGPDRLKGQALARAATAADLVLTSYPLVFRDEMTLQAVAWRGIVLDEAQNIKNASAKQTQAVKRLVEASEAASAQAAIDPNPDATPEPVTPEPTSARKSTSACKPAIEPGIEPAIEPVPEPVGGPRRSLPFRIALTGTPVENRLSELWSIMDFLNPGYLGTEKFFQKRFAFPIERYGDGASLHTLRSLVRPFILRRLKTDRSIIQDLPEKQEMPVFCGLSEKQARLYQALVDQALAEIETSDGIQRRGKILALLVRLKQLCNHPALLEAADPDQVLNDSSASPAAPDPGQAPSQTPTTPAKTTPAKTTRTKATTTKTSTTSKTSKTTATAKTAAATKTGAKVETKMTGARLVKTKPAVPADPRPIAAEPIAPESIAASPAPKVGPGGSLVSADSPKLQRLQEMLDELLSEGDRALIFTQFARWGELLQRHLSQTLAQEVLFFHGGLNQKQRDSLIDRFQNDPQGPKLLILSLKAGGVGLNLTRANHVFHFDRWWNPAVENQATDRAFRIGQTRNVQVHKFVCQGTLEEKIHDLIESKKVLAESIVGTGEAWLTELDTDGLRDLLLLDRAAIVTD